MDTTYVQDIKSRMDSEQARKGPPEEFPELPDLPMGRYLSEDLFQAELEMVFGQSWLFAGHVSEYPETGSYRLLEIPTGPVFLIRGGDGVLRAFRNACRHRSAPIVRDERGTAPSLLVCPYHAWSYDLTGRLVGVPEERDFKCLAKETRGLVPVRCETWGGFVFVTLDSNAMPLLDSIAPLAKRYSDLIESDFRYVTTRTWDVRCNWKAIVEAFVEIYHLAAVHPTTIHPFIDIHRGVILLHPRGHSSMFVPFRVGDPGGAHEEMDRFLPRDVPTVPDLPSLYRDASPSLFAFPNLVAPTDATGFPMIMFWPLAIDRTRIELHWYAPDDGSRDELGPIWDFKLASWEVLMEEDNQNLEAVQRAIETAAHQGIPLNYQERRIWQIHATIDSLIGLERIPENLRVPDLLSHCIEP